MVYRKELCTMHSYAENAFDTQTYFASLTKNTPVPRNQLNILHSEFNPLLLKERLDEKNHAIQCLSCWLESRGVFLPSSLKSNRHEDIMTIFVLSLEGTITPLSYYQEIVVPLAVEHLPRYMEIHYPNDKKLLHLMQRACSLSTELKNIMVNDKKSGFIETAKTELVRRCFTELIHREVQKGLCVSCVRHLIGELWEDALDSGAGGATAGPTRVFADVASFLRAFPPPHSHPRPSAGVVVFSASSARAQRAFLRRTQHGDLSKHVMDYADTETVGGKLSPRSYTKLRCHLIGQMAREDHPGELRLVFVSDNLTELSSAEASGSVDCSLLCVRPFSKWMNLETLTAVGIPHISSLEQLLDLDAPVDHVAIVEDAAKLVV